MSYRQRMKESLLQVLEAIYREHPDESEFQKEH